MPLKHVGPGGQDLDDSFVFACCFSDLSLFKGLLSSMQISLLLAAMVLLASTGVMFSDPALAAMEPSIASLQAELEDARDEAELNLLQLQQVQEELEHYFLRCQQLEQSQHITEPSATPADPHPLPTPNLNRLLPLMLEQLNAADLLSLAHRCHTFGHHQLAMPLLDAAVTRAAETDPVLAARAQLQAARSRLALGRCQGAERLLQAMAGQDLPVADVRRGIREQLAWLALQRSDIDAATQHLQAAELHDGVLPALLNGHAQQNAMPSGATVLPSAEAPGLSLDGLSISPCGRLLQLDGWLIDAQQQLAALVLRRPGQLLPLPLDQLNRRVRSDLSHLLQERGLPADHPAGFGMLLPLADEEAVAPTADEPCTLFLIRHDGGFVAVGRSLQVVAPTATDLLPLVSPWLFTSVDPSDPAAWDG